MEHFFIIIKGNDDAEERNLRGGGKCILQISFILPDGSESILLSNDSIEPAVRVSGKIVGYGIDHGMIIKRLARRIQYCILYSLLFQFSKLLRKFILNLIIQSDVVGYYICEAQYHKNQTGLSYDRNMNIKVLCKTNDGQHEEQIYNSC